MGQVQGCWSQQYFRNSIEEGKSSVLLFSFQLAIENKFKTVNFQGDKKKIIQAIMPDDFVE